MTEIITRLTRLARDFTSTRLTSTYTPLGQGHSDVHDHDDIDAELQRLESDVPLSSSSEKHSPMKTTVKNEIVVYTQYMMPLLLNQAVYRYCLVFAPIQAMGKIGGTHLAAGSLANATLNICVFSVVYGMGGSLDTLSTQAHGAQTKRDLNLLYALRVTLCICISYTVFVPFICFFPFALLGVEPDAAEIARSYMRWALLGLPGFVGYECVRKYTQAMGRMSGPMVATLSAAPFMLLVLRSNVAGEHTPPLALATFLNLSFASVSLWAYLVLPESTWQDIPTFKEVSTDLKIVFKIGSANVVSTCSDWFAWEYLSFVSAWQGNLILSGNAVLITSAFTFYTLPAALSNGVPSRVGNWVGRNCPREAKLSAYVAIWYAVAIGSTGGFLIFLMRKPWVALFTTDTEISALVSGVMPYFCAIVALDAWQGCWMAILRGAGLPIQIAHAMLIGHYAVGLPAATIFALLFHWNLMGLWSGFALGLSVVSWRLYVMIAKVDWVKQAQDAQTHVENTSKALEQGRQGQESLEVRLDELRLQESRIGEVQ